MICFRQPDLLILLSIITASEAIGDFGIDCRKDSECTRSDPNLRCYSKPSLTEFGDVGASTNGSSVQGYVGHQMGGSQIKMKRP